MARFDELAKMFSRGDLLKVLGLAAAGMMIPKSARAKKRKRGRRKRQNTSAKICTWRYAEGYIVNGPCCAPGLPCNSATECLCPPGTICGSLILSPFFPDPGSPPVTIPPGAYWACTPLELIPGLIPQ